MPLDHRIYLRGVRALSSTAWISAALAALSILGFAPAQAQELSVSGSRPLAKALDVLHARYGYVTSYEDPPYECDEDRDDVTGDTRKDLNQYPPGKAPRVIIPRRYMLSVPNSGATVSGRPESADSALARLVAAQNDLQVGGRFSWFRQGGMLHIVPSGSRDADGVWVPRTSILVAPISIPKRTWNGVELVTAVAGAIGKANGTQLVVGSMPLNAFVESEIEFSADTESARSVLLRVLSQIPVADGYRLTWSIFYSPTDRIRVLNLRALRDPSLPPPARTLPPGASDPSIGVATPSDRSGDLRTPARTN